MLGTGNTKLAQTHNFLPGRFYNLFMETNAQLTMKCHNEKGLNVEERKFYELQEVVADSIKT